MEFLFVFFQLSQLAMDVEKRFTCHRKDIRAPDAPPAILTFVHSFGGRFIRVQLAVFVPLKQTVRNIERNKEIRKFDVGPSKPNNPPQATGIPYLLTLNSNWLNVNFIISFKSKMDLIKTFGHCLILALYISNVSRTHGHVRTYRIRVLNYSRGLEMYWCQ